MSGTVTVPGVRTSIGTLGSSLSRLPAVTWALGPSRRRRASLPSDQVDYVAMGQVLQAGQGQNPARQVTELR